MGWGNTLKAIEIPGVNLVAVCDVDQNVIQKVKSQRRSTY